MGKCKRVEPLFPGYPVADLGTPLEELCTESSAHAPLHADAAEYSVTIIPILAQD